MLPGLLRAGARRVPVRLSASPAFHQDRLLSGLWVLEAPGSLPDSKEPREPLLQDRPVGGPRE